MPTIAGLRGTGKFATDERPKSFREYILFRDPNGQAPLTALMSKAKSEKVDDPEFNWWEEELTIHRMTLNDGTGMVAADNVFVVDNGANLLREGDIIQIEKAETTAYDNELVRVTVVDSDTQFTAVRGWAGTVAGAVADNTALTVIGNAQAEGSLRPRLASNNPTKRTNFCQIFRTPFGITRTASKTKTRTGEALKNDRKRAMFRHATQLEQAFIWGKPHEEIDAGENQPRRSTGGLRHFITTNVKIYSVSPTLNDFFEFLGPVFDFNAEGAGDERIAFCGNGALMKLNNLIREDGATQIQYGGIVDVYGMKLNKIVLPFGTLYLKTHPLFNVHPVYKYSLLGINPASVIWRYIDDTHENKDIQEKGRDGKEYEWLTEGGLEMHHEKTFFYIGNFKTI